jgi:hypothetical protein
MKLQRKQKPSPALEKRRQQPSRKCAAQEIKAWCDVFVLTRAPMFVML